jgi:hypothetical protein
MDRQATEVERQQRINRAEGFRLEYRTNLPEYSRERQQVRDRAYRNFRDVEFISATLRGNSGSE